MERPAAVGAELRDRQHHQHHPCDRDDRGSCEVDPFFSFGPTEQVLEDDQTHLSISPWIATHFFDLSIGATF